MAIKVKPKPYDKTVILGATTAEVVSPKAQPVKPVQPSMPTPTSISNPEMVDINAANRANAAAQALATPVASGPTPLNRTGRELLDAELNAQGQAGFDLFGVNNPRSQGELVQKTKLEQEMERARQEQQQKTQFDIMGLQNQQVQQQMRGAEAASVAGLAQGREGPVSASAPMAMEQARTFYAQNRAILEAKTAQTNRDMLNARADLQKAQDEGNTRLASQIQSRIVSLEQEQSKANLATQQALNEAAKIEIAQSAEERAKQQNKVSNLNTFMGWVADGQSMTPQMISSFAENTGIESGPLYETYAKNQAIRDDKTLNLEQKQQAYASNAIDLQRKVKGLDDTKAQQINYLSQMRQQGRSQEDISAYKQLVGIKDQDDPMYQLDLKYKQAQIQAQQTGSALDKANLAKIYNEIQQANGSATTYVPSGTTFNITTTANGIAVGAKDGEDGGQCGRFANNVFGVQSFFSDLYEDKKKKIDSLMPAPGMAFVAPAYGNYAANGHVGIVESVNADGSFNIVDSNRAAPNKVGRKTLTINDVDGFVKPPNAKALNSQGEQTGLYADYLSTAKSQGMSQKQAEAFAEKRVNEAFSPMTGPQASAFSAYSKLQPENEEYLALTADLDQEEFANTINVISSKLKDTETPLTAQIINKYVADPTQRRAIISEMRWIEGKLRKESGAAISVGEYLNNGVEFFPRAGDDTGTIDDKARARLRIQNALKAEIGPAGQRQLKEANDLQNQPKEDPNDPLGINFKPKNDPLKLF